jgi:dipeptidyl aminopeptidase/acylaminoacyl peptidase
VSNAGPRVRNGAMPAVRSGWVALAALCLAPITHGADLEAYGRLPRIEDIALSPDGTHVAFVKTEGDTRLVAVVALARNEMLRGLRFGDQKLRAIRWADDNRLLIVTTATTSVTSPYGPYAGPRGEWAQLKVLDIRNGELFEAPTADRIKRVDVVKAILGVPSVGQMHNHTVLYVRGVQFAPTAPAFTRAAPALIRVDLETRESRVIRPGQEGNFGWLVDDSGEIAAEELYVEHDHRWSIFATTGGHFHEVASGQEEIEIPRLLGRGPDGDSLLLEQLKDGQPEWRPLSLKDGTIGAPLALKNGLESPLYDPYSNRLIGGVHEADSAQYVFFAPELQEKWNTVLAPFAGERVLLTSWTPDFSKVIVRVDGAQHGLRYMLVDIAAARATSLGEVYEGVGQPLEVQRITYPAGDGTQIPAYLTLPRGREAKHLPLVVLPHGGPAVRDTADFDWWSQALASEGYAVLRPNYRGSDLGWPFMSAGFGEWGRKMQTDLSDGVRYLAKQGVIDPARVCIVGASYGGYAALAGVTLDPGVYRCAVSVAGISNLHHFLLSLGEWRPGPDDRARRYLDRFLGAKGTDDPALDAISPVKHLDAITVPVLLIHGRDDLVVPYAQSEEMYEAARRAHKDIELVPLKAEDHWLSRSATRLQMLQSSVAFLRAHNPPDP